MRKIKLTQGKYVSVDNEDYKRLNKHNRTYGSSQYKGVNWNKQLKKWMACIMLNDKRIHLGLYNNEIKAAKAYDRRAKEIFGKFAYLNFR